MLLLFPTSLPAAKKKPTRSQDSSFSYYVLSLSYAPDFCDEPGGTKDPRECGAGRRLGFVVHGLWPQAENGRGPEHCTTASPVSQSIVNLMLAYIPSASLIQHEWSTHGVCSGLAAADYFAAVRKARDAVTIPADLDHPAQTLHLSPAAVESKLAAANPRYPPAAFTVSCYRDGELQELRVCLAKDLSPRACSKSAGACSLATIRLLPVR